MVVSHDPVERKAAAAAVAALENIGKASAKPAPAPAAAAPAPLSEMQGPPEAPPLQEQVTVSASPLPTLMEQLTQRQTELLNAPPQSAPPPPRELSVGERLNMAFAGLDPQFRRDVVQPEIDKRRGFVADQQAFQQEQVKAEQEKIKSTLPFALEEQRGIEDLKDQQKQADALREGYGGLAEDYTALVGDGESPGPVISLISTLRSTGQASHAQMAERLEADAALIELGIIKADAGVPQTPEGLARLLGKFQELSKLSDAATAALAFDENAAAANARVMARQGTKIPPSVIKEAEIWSSVRDTAQLILGRRELQGDIGGPLAGKFSFMIDLQAQEEADLSIMTGAIGRAIGGGAALTPFEKATLVGLYTQVTNTNTEKKARLNALMGFSQRKLDGIQKQYGDLGYGAANADEVEQIRQMGGVKVSDTAEGYPVFQMPNGDIVEVSP